MTETPPQSGSGRKEQTKSKAAPSIAGSILHSACSRSFVENRRWQVKGIEINRKMLSEMAINDAVAFTALCDLAKNA